MGLSLSTVQLEKELFGTQDNLFLRESRQVKGNRAAEDFPGEFSLFSLWQEVKRVQELLY